MSIPRLLVALLVVSCFVTAQHGCTSSSTPGLTALPDLGAGTYTDSANTTFVGGLYPNSLNDPPAAHADAALHEASQIVPLDVLGNPSVDGRIGVIALGLSLTGQTFNGWREEHSEFAPDRNPAVATISGVTGGTSATDWKEPPALTGVWRNAFDATLASGLSVEQVQVAFIMMASEHGPGGSLAYRNELFQVVRHTRTVFPNCRLAYLTSVPYLGYATSQNPGRCEPCGYETGFGVKALIEMQINPSGGSLALNHDPLVGPVNAPLLLWGPYLWANGDQPSSNGHAWLCTDLAADGVHLSPAGRTNVAELMSTFFRTHPTTLPWYLQPAGAGAPPVALATKVVPACHGTLTPKIGAKALIGGDLVGPATPWLGNLGFRITVKSFEPMEPDLNAELLLTWQIFDPLPACGGWWLDPNTQLEPVFAVMTDDHLAHRSVPIPFDPGLQGTVFYAQWRVIGNAQTVYSQPMRLRIGAQ